MSGSDVLAPTRANLLRARRRREQVRKGASILRRKREALVVELFRLARPAADLRAEIATALDAAYASLLDAVADHGQDALRAIAWPPVPPSVRVESSRVWGVESAILADRSAISRTLDARGLAPAMTGPTTLETARRFEHVSERLLDAAALEQRVARLSDAVARGSRQLRTLEQRVEPRLAVAIATVRRTLEEREREERLRLKHVQKRRAAAHVGRPPT